MIQIQCDMCNSEQQISFMGRKHQSRLRHFDLYFKEKLSKLGALSVDEFPLSLLRY